MVGEMCRASITVPIGFEQWRVLSPARTPVSLPTASASQGDQESRNVWENARVLWHHLFPASETTVNSVPLFNMDLFYTPLCYCISGIQFFFHHW